MRHFGLRQLLFLADQSFSSLPPKTSLIMSIVNCGKKWFNAKPQKRSTALENQSRQISF